jgi:outer membrane protein assembly factor BamB
LFAALVLAMGIGSDWPMFAHDARRTGFQPNSDITERNIPQLALHWRVALGKYENGSRAFTASPIVANGVVYICSRGGNVYALRESDGSLIWKRHVGPDIRMTPLLDGGRLYVGVYGIEPVGKFPLDAAFLALDPANGKVLWRVALPGVVRSEAVIVDHIIYEGTAGGDAGQGGVNGRIVAIDEASGRLHRDVWRTSIVGHAGGGIWSPISSDGKAVYFGTGNTVDGSGFEDSIVSITTGLKTRWAVRTKAPTGEDEDVGSGVMLRNGVAYCKGKSGILYAIDTATGRTKFAVTVHPDFPGGGGFGTPTGDGSIVVASSGDASTNAPYSKLVAFDRNGAEVYDIAQHEMATPSLQASFVRGAGFAALDRSLIAFSARTGKILWTYPTASGFYANPAITREALYDVDLAGNVYALALGAVTVRADTAIVTKETANGIPSPREPGRRRWLLAGLLALIVAIAGSGIVLRSRTRKAAVSQRR